MPRFTAQHDDFIVRFFDVVGELIETDLPQSWPSIRNRAKLLKRSGVWSHILRAQRYDWIAARERELLSPTQRLMDLDVGHPGSLIDSCHFNDLVGAKEYARETADWFKDCKRRAQLDLQYSAEPDRQELDKLTLVHNASRSAWPQKTEG